MYSYEDIFFDFVDESSGRSAGAFLDKFAQRFMPGSVLDVGCGRGVWLNAWAAMGVTDISGVDGGYVRQSSLKIPVTRFFAQDISLPFSLNRRFDLVQCLEVAEHLPEAKADILLKNLVTHGDVILFSAAQPGQGGEYHVNEQPLNYWASKFRSLGYKPFDYPRKAVEGLKTVEPWYRYNTLLYINDNGVSKLPPEISATYLPDVNTSSYISFTWRIRCGLFSMLPRRVIHSLARCKHQIAQHVRRLKEYKKRLLAAINFLN